MGEKNHRNHKLQQAGEHSKGVLYIKRNREAFWGKGLPVFIS